MADTKNARPIIGFVAALGILAVLFTMGILPRLHKNKTLASDAKEAANAPTPVQFVTPTPAPTTNEIALPGSMQPLEEATIYGRASGYVRARYVDIGSKVKKGQLLAEIETPEVDQQLLQAQADRAKAEATVGQSKADEGRLRVGVLQAQSEVHRFEANLRQAQAAQKRADAKITQTKALYANAQAKVEQTREAAQQRQANLAQAVANLNIAQKTLTRWNQLVKSGAVAQQDVDERQATADARKADVTAAQAAVRSAQSDIDAAQASADSAKSDITAALDDLEAAKSTVKGAQAALRSSQTNVEASRSSVAVGVAATQASRANVRSSDANTQRVATLKRYQRVVAPFDGIITARNVDAGSLVKADNDNGTATSMGLFKIARADTLRIQVNVPQTYFASIKDGQAAQVFVKELPGRVFTGTVKRNAGALSDASRTLLTEILLPNTDNALLPGMYAQVKFTVGAASQAAVRIPASALINNADGLQVAAVDENSAVHLLKIVVARDYGAELDIASGLTGKERLIINPSDSLQEGGKVTATPAPPPPPPPGK